MQLLLGFIFGTSFDIRHSGIVYFASRQNCLFAHRDGQSPSLSAPGGGHFLNIPRIFLEFLKNIPLRFTFLYLRNAHPYLRMHGKRFRIGPDVKKFSVRVGDLTYVYKIYREKTYKDTSD